MENQRQLYRFLREGKSFSGQERNCCFLNLGNGQFANISAASGFDFADDARALALSDWDRDGDLDLWVSNRTGPRTRFLQNTSSTSNRVIQLSLRGRSGNRDAIGTRVTVRSPAWLLQRSLRAGDGYLAQSSKWVHLSLPADTGTYDVQVEWVGGQPQSLGELAPGRYVVEEGMPPRAVEGTDQVERCPAEGQTTVVSPESQTTFARLHAPVAVPAIPTRTADGEDADGRLASIARK